MIKHLVSLALLLTFLLSSFDQVENNEMHKILKRSMPFETLSYGKRDSDVGALPFETLSYGKRLADDAEEMNEECDCVGYANKRNLPFETLSYGRKRALPFETLSYGRKRALPFETLNYGRKRALPFETLNYGKRDSMEGVKQMPKLAYILGKRGEQ